MESIQLPHLAAQPLRACLFKDVQNAAFLRQQLLDGNQEFEYAFLDASVLLSRNHVLAACFRAVNDVNNGRMRSRNVHSEIVFALSPNNNVRDLHLPTLQLQHSQIVIADTPADCRSLPSVWRLYRQQEHLGDQSWWRCFRDCCVPQGAHRWCRCTIFR